MPCVDSDVLTGVLTAFYALGLGSGFLLGRLGAARASIPRGEVSRETSPGGHLPDCPFVRDARDCRYCNDQP